MLWKNKKYMTPMLSHSVATDTVLCVVFVS